MEQLAIFGFWASVIVIFYVLAGYPLALALSSRRGSKAVDRRWAPKTVSIVIPIFNGERWIQQKLESITQLDYPSELVQIILINDGSTDGTAELIRRLAPARTEIVEVGRGGKAAALNAGIRRASGDLLFFTDIRQRLEPGCLRSLVECLGDPSVGVVSGELVILSGATQQEADIGLYWRYEKWIRKHQSRFGTVPGATGSIYAMRRELAVTLPPRILLDDVYLPMGAYFRGYRVIFDERARAFDFPTQLKSEFRRKVRTQAGVYQILAVFPQLLIPATRMWFHFGSHKIGRLLLPFAMIFIAVCSFALPGDWKTAALSLQAGFYGLATLDGWIPRSKFKRASSLARTFVVLVGAALCAPAFLVFARGNSAWSVTEVQPATAGMDGGS
jgi:cellulose synthase/poly-beta-1,6-N-acetylglucosamine synthase-like glycosyltransferase